MTMRQRVMLLIDADNVSADVIEQAVHRTLDAHGAVHVRRAYCNADTALKQQALFKRLSVRPMVNLSAGKNSTDIAMAVDAMDLVIAERPELVVLVSSDSDFAPLVVRLREKGARVCGIGQRGKTGDETRAAYDEFIDLTHQGARAPAAPPAAPATPTAASTPASVTKPARKVAAKKVAKTAARKTAAKKDARVSAPAGASPTAAPAAEAAALVRRPAARKAARKTATTVPAAAPSPAVPPAAAAVPASAASETAERILQAVPALRGGSEVALNDIAKALRAAKLLGKHASSIKLFDKLPSEFAVLQHPDRIRWLGATRA